MKILVVLSRVPYPLEKGDKLRAYHQIRVLSQYYDIYLIALNDTPLHPQAETELRKYCKDITVVPLSWPQRLWNMFRFFFKGLPIQCGYFYNNKARNIILQKIADIHPDHIYCQFLRVAEYVKKVKIPKTLDYQDVLSKGMQRRYEAAPWYAKPFFKMEYRRLHRYERNIFPYFDNKTIITAVDRDMIPHSENEKIVVVANGVDFSQYVYSDAPKEYDLIFSGNMSYAPNIDAAEYLAKEIFPQLKMEFPDLKLVLCGTNPAARVQALRSKDVIVTGWVDSMSEYYGKSRIFIAPMRLGTGLQNKLLEAMAMKLPCVTSTLAGRPLEGIEEGREVIICNNTTGFVDAVRLLLTNPDKYAEISENGYRFVKEHYNWEAMTQKLVDLMK
ncbi:MAG: glycosyltransferase [Bacteroidales bacterium]|nr:glycosyltransferase [Bacteroidales bacterium]